MNFLVKWLCLLRPIFSGSIIELIQKIKKVKSMLNSENKNREQREECVEFHPRTSFKAAYRDLKMILKTGNACCYIRKREDGSYLAQMGVPPIQEYRGKSEEVSFYYLQGSVLIVYSFFGMLLSHLLSLLTFQSPHLVTRYRLDSGDAYLVAWFRGAHVFMGSFFKDNEKSDLG